MCYFFEKCFIVWVGRLFMDKLEIVASGKSLGTRDELSSDEIEYLTTVSSVEDSCFSCNMEPCRACYGPHIL